MSSDFYARELIAVEKRIAKALEKIAVILQEEQEADEPDEPKSDDDNQMSMFDESKVSLFDG